ncbi:MAG TPA: PHP-associated domain-containing protein [Chloroflexota bacterium]|nr:PHP-associated domain-containing protein [Chloroflexota bacterium]
MLKCDLHLHSFISSDGIMSLDTIIQTCLRRGVNCIALTDHNRFGNALELQRRAPFTVIPGEEIKTTEGEIIGLFLEREIPRGLTPRETVAEIRRQGGVVYIPHPFDRIRKSVLARRALMEIVDDVDVIEVLNARISFKADVEEARQFALQHDILQGAGSDSHVWWELGNAYVEMPEFEGRDGFLVSLAKGTVRGKLSSPAVHLASSFNKLRNKYLKR